MRHQPQKGFWVIFVGTPQHHKVHLVYVPSTWKIVSSHAVVFKEIKFSALEYSSQPYSEELATRSVILYIPYATSSHEQAGNIISFAHFEEGDLLENLHNTEEYESISDSIDELSTYDDYGDGSISTNTLEDIQDGIQMHIDINARDDKSKTRDHIKQTQSE